MGKATKDELAVVSSELKEWVLNSANVSLSDAQKQYGGGPLIEKIVCQIRAAPEVNARVTRISDSHYEYLIEIFTGLIGRLMSGFTLCALHPDFPYRKTFIEAGLPAEKARATLAIVLLNLATTFVTFHEFAHLVTGHLSLLKAMGAIEALDESPDLPFPQEVSSLDRQTLEANADATAAILLVGQTLSHQDQHAQRQDMPWFKSAETSIELMFFSIIAFFWASGVRLHDLSALDEPGYPPNTLRERMVVRAVVRYIEHRLSERRGDKTPILKEPVLQIAVRAANVFDKCFPFAEQLPPLADLLAQTNDARIETHILRIGDNWQILAKRLEGLKHGGNLRTGRIIIRSTG